VTNYRDEAIVLRTYRLGESDRIVVLLTESNGKVRAVAKGVRKTRSRLGSRLEPLSYVSVLLHKGRELDIVSQVEPLDTASGLRSNLDKLTQGLAMLEAVDQMTIDREPVPHIHRMLVGALGALARDGSSLVVGAFYLKLLAAEGFEPELSRCTSCATADDLVPFVPHGSSRLGRGNRSDAANPGRPTCCGTRRARESDHARSDPARNRGH
jgi:DNA repair protein RecO (recombination protein O)